MNSELLNMELCTERLPDFLWLCQLSALMRCSSEKDLNTLQLMQVSGLFVWD